MPQATPFFEAMNTYFFPNLGLGIIDTSQFIDSFHTDFTTYDITPIMKFVKNNFELPKNISFTQSLYILFDKETAKKIETASNEEYEMITDFYEKLILEEEAKREEERKTQQTAEELERDLCEYFGE